MVPYPILTKNYFYFEFFHNISYYEKKTPHNCLPKLIFRIIAKFEPNFNMQQIISLNLFFSICCYKYIYCATTYLLLLQANICFSVIYAANIFAVSHIWTKYSEKQMQQIFTSCNPTLCYTWVYFTWVTHNVSNS